MIIHFYKNTIPKNRLYRTLTGHLESTGHLKEGCNIENPVIRMTYNAYPVNINYCYIPDFGRYYFINDYRIEGDFIYLYLHVDVLYTYRDTILNSQAIAMRSSSHGNLYLKDDFVQAETGYRYNVSKFPYNFASTGGTYILYIAGR